mmetsp:Transcript_95037/g.277908  ORF Transcript_95037/g.277908 Transcript_95037/m.277908 type:complete len:598 (-) Transcript_95037:125-1918(-)
MLAGQEEFQVFVELLSGKTVTVDVAPTDTLDDLRHKLHFKTALPHSEHVQLLLNGKLMDSLRHVEMGSTIRMAGRLRGGGAMKLKEAFKKFDRNGDGKLQFDDFLAMLRRGRPNFDLTQAEALFEVVDRDLSGEIDFHEFIDYLYDHKSLQDFLLPVLADPTEEEAKAFVLNQTLKARSAASSAVKKRGQTWSSMTWKERMHEVLQVSGSPPFSPAPASPAPASPKAPSAWLPEPQASEEPAPDASGGLPSLLEAAEVLAAAAPAEEAEAPPVEGLMGVARETKKKATFGASHAMAEMSQSELVDYSLMREDLCWAGESEDVLGEMTAFKEHLRTAGGPLDAVNVERYVAKGTAGWVFQVSRKTTGERVALKLIRMTQVRTGMKEWYVSKLLKEDGLANLVFTDEKTYVLEKETAPEIIKEELQDAGPVPYYVCFVQEFVDGGTLEGLARDGKLTPPMLLQAMEGLATTLAQMHANNIQHKDIKPENALVRMDGGALAAVKLCDFGRAEIFESPAGRRDDIRRFGVMLYSLATGEGWTANRLIHEEHSTLVKRLREAVQASGDTALQGLPAALEKILDGGLEMNEVAELLRKLRADL